MSSVNIFIMNYYYYFCGLASTKESLVQIQYGSELRELENFLPFPYFDSL